MKRLTGLLPFRMFRGNSFQIVEPLGKKTLLAVMSTWFWKTSVS